MNSSNFWRMATGAAGFAVSLSCMAYTDLQYEEANRALQSVYAGDDSAIPVALEKFKALSATEPGDPLLLVNVGAATTLRARTTILPWKKISYAEDGMALQDKALALASPEFDKKLHQGTPVSLQVRMVAASTFLAVPSRFNRQIPGGKLLNDLLADPLFETAHPQFKGAVWMRAARLAVDEKRGDDARKYLQHVVDSHGPQAEAAKAQLALLK